MPAHIEDEFGLDADRYPKPKRRKLEGPDFLSDLHRLMHRGLPDYLNEKGVLDARELARKIGISFQALYQLWNRNQISRKRVETIIKLSESTKKVPAAVDGVEWKPLTKDDLWKFLSN